MPEQETVLLIDDEREILRSVALRMRCDGFRVISAWDGQQGLDLASKESPDAIVLDIRMPVMDGWTVLTHLKERSATACIPVVMLSASIQERSYKRALDLGARYFLEKPFDAGTLVGTVHAAIDEAHHSRGGVQRLKG